MVSHSWIKKSLGLLGVDENIKTLLVNSMKKWRVLLCAGSSELEEIDMKQGNSLTPLIFVLALISLSLILRKAKAAYEFSGIKLKINHF